MNFGEMASHYVESPQFLTLAPMSRRMYESYLERLIAIGGDLPVTDAQLLLQRPRSRSLARSPEKNLVGLWFDAINSIAGATNPTKLAMRTTLSVVYKWGVVRGYLTAAENFVHAIPKVAWKHEILAYNPHTLSDMEAIERSIAIGAIPKEILPYAYLGIFAFDSGCRPDQLYKHKRQWFTKRDGETYMEIHGGKGKAVGEISGYVWMGSRSLTILEWFKSMPKYMGFESLTFRTDKGRAFSQPLVCEKWKEVCRLSGVEERKFYMTRHGLATTMSEAGHSDEEIAARLGNTPAVVRKHYINKSKFAKAKLGRPVYLSVPQNKE